MEKLVRIISLSFASSMIIIIIVRRSSRTGNLKLELILLIAAHISITHQIEGIVVLSSGRRLKVELYLAVLRHRHTFD